MGRLKEGKIHKGGQNQRYQIEVRPPDPPGWRPRVAICGWCDREYPADGVTRCPCRQPERPATVDDLWARVGRERAEIERLTVERDAWRGIALGVADAMEKAAVGIRSAASRMPLGERRDGEFCLARAFDSYAAELRGDRE